MKKLRAITLSEKNEGGIVDIKYTKDGRKVRVVGNLNRNEMIVQEIFVDSGGAEIPSGENFVVNDLFDSPVKSWKEYEIEKIDSRYESMKREQETNISKFKKLQSSVLEQIRNLSLLKRNMSNEKLRTLDLFLAGKITHFVENSDYRIKITKFSDEHCQYNRDRMKLLVLFGSSKGDLNWSLSSYSDGSGPDRTVTPCTSKEQAIKVAKERVRRHISDGKITDDFKRFAEEHKIHIPQNILDEHRDKKMASKLKEAQRLREQLEKKIKEIESL